MALRSLRQKNPQTGCSSAIIKHLERSRSPIPSVNPVEAPLLDIQTQLETAQRFGHYLGNYSRSTLQRFPLHIQPKLTIGAPGDKYEQEADRVAQQVVQRMNTPVLGRSQPDLAVQRESVPEDAEIQLKPVKPAISQIQRQEATEEEDEELQKKSSAQHLSSDKTAILDLESAIAQSRNGGQPLANSIRQPMEQAFGGANFSGVKIHTNAESDQLNRSLQSTAFTTKQDIFFRQGAYQPENREGQELIAHELTHVVQQTGAIAERPMVQRELIVAGETHTDYDIEVQDEQQTRTMRDVERAWGKKAYGEYWTEHEFTSYYGEDKEQARLMQYGSLQGDPPLLLLQEDIAYLHTAIKTVKEQLETIKKDVYNLYEIPSLGKDPLQEARGEIKSSNNLFGLTTAISALKKGMTQVKRHLDGGYEAILGFMDSFSHWEKTDEAYQTKWFNLNVDFGTRLLPHVVKMREAMEEAMGAIGQWEKQAAGTKSEEDIGTDAFLLTQTVIGAVEKIEQKKSFEATLRDLHKLQAMTENVTKARSEAMHHAAEGADAYHENGIWKVGEQHVRDIKGMENVTVKYNLMDKDSFEQLRDKDTRWPKPTKK